MAAGPDTRIINHMKNEPVGCRRCLLAQEGVSHHNGLFYPDVAFLLQSGRLRGFQWKREGFLPVVLCRVSRTVCAELFGQDS